MIRQSRNIGLTTLQTQFVTGGSYVVTSSLGVSVPLNLSLIYNPSAIGAPLDVEISALIDGVIKSGGPEPFARGEIWRNGVLWKNFGAPSGYTESANNSIQLSSTFTDSIPANSPQIIYSLYGSCWKIPQTVTSSQVSFNWGLSPNTFNLGGGTTASFIRLVERTRS